MKMKTGWLVLILALPTESATARMRFWRALKSLGCAVIRDGVYLLPATLAHEQAFQALCSTIVDAGGTANLLSVENRYAEQDTHFRSLFDRRADYVAFEKAITSTRKSLARLAPSEINRLVRRLRKEYDAIRATDYFPNDVSSHTDATWSDFLGAVTMVLSPDEPHAADSDIRTLSKNAYQGRTWATRRRLWVDRVASAWLIRRFIDQTARFLWLAKPSACPKKALGFDFDGAAFSHVGERVTFEVLVASFALAGDRGLVRLGQLVRALDTGGAVVPEAVGFEAVLGGARARGLDDDQMLEEIGQVLDSLHAHYNSQEAIS